MAKINKQHKWDTCIHALSPFGRGFALCSYSMDFKGKELSAKDFPLCMDNGKCRKEEAEKEEKKMIYNKNGEMFFYEDKMFIIGEEVFASESDYAGLLGRITEIRTGEDRDTENEGPDIYCAFREPILRLDAELLSKLRISNEDASIDEIIMAPEMLIPTREVGAGEPKMKVYAVIEDCVVDGVDKSETKLFVDKQHAEIVMRRSIEEEREDGCIQDWRFSDFLVEEQYDDLYFTAYFKNEYCFNHYTVYVKEMELALSVTFAKDTLSAIYEANRQLSRENKLPH